ncbi:MAG: hypothetical protein KDH96_03820 [Candidatus Riesia sp.]|nr:hypothetical protein [Candidatus Riesia sp.]
MKIQLYKNETEEKIDFINNLLDQIDSLIDDKNEEDDVILRQSIEEQIELRKRVLSNITL